jgi:hypothetical protein
MTSVQACREGDKLPVVLTGAGVEIDAGNTFLSAA